MITQGVNMSLKHASVVVAVTNAFNEAIKNTIAATRLKSDGGRRITEAEFGEIAKAAYRNLQRVTVKIPVPPTEDVPNPDPIEVPMVDDGLDEKRAKAKADAEARRLAKQTAVKKK